MKKIFYSSCAILGLVSLANCTKSSDVEIKDQSAELTASIMETKTTLNGLDVTWAKGDEIGIQLKSIHSHNRASESENEGKFPATMGVYKLSTDAAGKKEGAFSFNSDSENPFNSADEKIGDEDEFFAFYPAKYCEPQKGNGYFYMNFPTTQYYEDNIGDNLSLPMYGVGKNRNIKFQYAGAVIKLKLWASTETNVNSIIVSSDTELPRSLFTYIPKGGDWRTSLSDVSSSVVTSFTIKMREPLKLSSNEKSPTEVAIVIPVKEKTILKNLSFTISSDLNGCVFKKSKAVTITPGDAMSFPAKEVVCGVSKMSIDGGDLAELDVTKISTAKTSIAIVSPEGCLISEDMFRSIITACRSLDHSIDVDFSKAKAGFNTINGRTSDGQYVGFCGGNGANSGIKTINVFKLPEGITRLENMSLAGSSYTKVVVPASLTSIGGFPTRYNDKMVWEVNENNKTFKADDKGALYSFDMKQLMVLNGGSGADYVIPEGTESIREWCLYDNSVITTLTLPSTMTTLRANSIDGTPNLSTIICLGSIPAELKTLQFDTFKAKEKTIYVPGGSVDSYEKDWANFLNNGWTITTKDTAVNAGSTIIKTPESTILEF